MSGDRSKAHTGRLKSIFGECVLCGACMVGILVGISVGYIWHEGFHILRGDGGFKVPELERHSASTAQRPSGEPGPMGVYIDYGSDGGLGK